uniref:Uncharacterized protein S1SE2 n=1 Tax=Ipomoea trifida TaxID=35884 RepID=Q6JJ52_IPOTF|nr:hypothetical protein [Ipomoea trifida]BAF52536.1 hypothetical protein [Ipomoea trifida]
MTIKVHFIVPLYLLFLSITNVRTELSIGSIPLSWMDVDNYPLEKSIAVIGCFVIISVITLVLFKRNVIDSTGLIFGLWMLMSLDNAVLKSRKINNLLRYLLIYFHITVAFFGLTYWIRLSVRQYNIKNTRPSIDLLFEMGAWFFMFSLNCTLVAVQHLHRKKQYKVFEWYPIGTAFTSIVESYWKKGRKVRANQLKSQLIKKVEDAFHDFLRTCMKELQSSNIFEFNQKLNDFTRMLCILVAQQREALTITYQRALANGD